MTSTEYVFVLHRDLNTTRHHAIGWITKGGVDYTRIAKTLADYHLTSQGKLWKASTNSIMNHSSQIPIATAGDFNIIEGASKCLAIVVSLSLLLASDN